MTLASDAVAIARAGIESVDAYRATLKCLGDGPHALRVDGRVLRPGRGGRIHVVALGKAAGRMASAAVRRLGSSAPGLAVTSVGSPASRGRVRTLFGDHPIPGSRSVAAGRALHQYITGLSPDDAVLFLVSGGGSALAELPVAGVTLSDLRRTTELLLSSGAPVRSDNAIRIRLSRIKGGQLAALVPSGRYATVAISDVVGDPPDIIASGPTAPPRTRRGAARAAALRYGIFHRLPPRVRGLLDATHGSQPRAQRPVPAPFVFAATNATAVEGAAAEARRRGYRVDIVRRPVVGDTRVAASGEARALVRGATRGRALARISGGETTVVLGPHPGRGGRNQEFALVAATFLASRPAALVSVGTDGIDGPTDAAGAWVDGGTLERANHLGVDVRAALARHDAYPALDRLGALIRTGPTGTNVTDLHVGLAYGRARA